MYIYDLLSNLSFGHSMAAAVDNNRLSLKSIMDLVQSQTFIFFFKDQWYVTSFFIHFSSDDYFIRIGLGKTDIFLVSLVVGKENMVVFKASKTQFSFIYLLDIILHTTAYLQRHKTQTSSPVINYLATFLGKRKLTLKTNFYEVWCSETFEELIFITLVAPLINSLISS